MKTFIFGAGASLGAQQEGAGLRAPLVDQLFDDQYMGLVPSLGLHEEDFAEYRAAIGNGRPLEDWLTEQWDSLTSYSTEQGQGRLRRMFGDITFYIWGLMLKVSESEDIAYHRLLRKLAHADEPFGLISFNYDTLLDKAYQRVCGAVLQGDISSYLRHNYAKPHGSVNWFLETRTADTYFSCGEMVMDIRSRIRTAASLMFTGGGLSIEQSLVVEPGHVDSTRIEIIGPGRFQGPFGYPLVLIPLSSKMFGLVDKFHETMIDHARKMVSESSDVYLIGYRARDDIARDILQAAPPGTRLHVVSMGSSASIQEHALSLSASLIPGDAHKSGFLDFVDWYTSGP